MRPALIGIRVSLAACLCCFMNTCAILCVFLRRINTVSQSVRQPTFSNNDLAISLDKAGRRGWYSVAKQRRLRGPRDAACNSSFWNIHACQRGFYYDLHGPLFTADFARLILSNAYTRLGVYTQGDSDVISFHIYASWFSPPSCG